jgi:hypothetical protein
MSRVRDCASVVTSGYSCPLHRFLFAAPTRTELGDGEGKRPRSLRVDRIRLFLCRLMEIRLLCSVSILWYGAMQGLSE